MSSFEAGGLIFRLQTVGAQLFQKDQADAKAAVEKTGSAATAAKGSVDGLGTATDETGKKARAAKAPLDEQSSATEKLGKKTRQAGDEQQRQTKITAEQVAAARELSTGLLVAGAAVAALVTLSVVKYASFDQQMSNTAAATMATAEEQKALGEAALQAGADTAFSANEAAAAEEELAKAGISVADIVGGSLNGALSLAAAGQLAVARSAEIMATTLTQYGLKADQAAHVSDVLAAGAGKAQGSVDDLALALTYVGPLAASAGWSLEETGGALAYFASQGILGEKAGTSLRGVLAALQAPSTIAKKVMDQYGLSIYDANGNMLSAAQIAGNLQKAFGGLTQEERNAALGRIFGNESLVAANLLYEGGAKKVEEWTDQVDDAGYAAEQAAQRQDNLAGDIEKLGGSFDTALIKTGSGANDVLRDMVQAVTDLVDWYGELDPVVQAGALTIGIAAAAVLLLYGGTLKAVSGVTNLLANLKALNVSMKTTSLVAGGAAIAIAGVVAVVAALAAEHADAQARAKAYADTLEQGTNRVTKATRELVKENLAVGDSFLFLTRDSAYTSAEKLGLGLDLVTDAALGNADALKLLEEQLVSLEDGSLDTANQITDVREAVKGESSSIEEAIRVAEQKNRVTDESTEATESAISATDDHAKALGLLQGEAYGAGQEVGDLSDAIRNFGKTTLNTRDAQRGFEAAIDDLSASIKENGDSLDIRTEKGRANQSAIDDIAKSTLDWAAATNEQTGDQEAANEVIQQGRDRLIKMLEQFGITGEAAQEYVDQLGLIPDNVNTAAKITTTSAEDKIRSFIREYDGKEITLTLNTNQVVVGGRVYGGLRGSGQADGSVLEFYGNGGVNEHHVAQFARAGDVRVWAEPETGGEAYIPLSPAKRARSTQILAETADRFGYQLVPVGAQQYANGSPVGPSAGGNTYNNNVEVTIPAEDPRIAARLLAAELRTGLAST